MPVRSGEYCDISQNIMVFTLSLAKSVCGENQKHFKYLPLDFAATRKAVTAIALPHILLPCSLLRITEYGHT